MPGFEESAHPRDESGKFIESGGEKLSAWAKSRPKASSGTSPRIKMAEPGDFKSAFAQAFAASPFRNHVTHYTEEQLKGMKLFMTEDGKAGIAVHDHGDGRIEGTALFNQGGAKGAGLRLLQHAIDNAGVNYVECYGPVLNKLYEKLGFKVESESDFNREYAAPDWDYTKFPAERTHYFTMRLSK